MTYAPDRAEHSRPGLGCYKTLSDRLLAVARVWLGVALAELWGPARSISRGS
jgi:hypothetical protein